MATIRMIEMISLRDRLRAIKEKRGVTWGTIRADLWRLAKDKDMPFEMAWVARAASPSRPSACNAMRDLLHDYILIQEEQHGKA